MIPNFLGIGVQKSGTTWVYDRLIEHPEVYMPKETKEIHFFDKNYDKGIEWYKNVFINKTNEARVGEFTPDYIYKEKYIKRIKEHYPNIEIIVCLRDPVDRAISHYKKTIKDKQFKGNLLEAIEVDPFILEAGYYSELLSNVFKYFKHENVLIVVYEDMLENPEVFMEQIYNFLNINNSFKSNNLTEKSNVAMVPRSSFIYKYIYRTKNKLRNMGLGIIVNKLKPLLTKLFLKEPPTVSLSNEEITYLRKHYSDEIDKISTLIGRDFSGIWKS